MKNNYSVYMHIFPNDKKYIGITCRKPETRWANGNGYGNSRYIDRAIKKYGWENVRHDILMSGLTKSQAETWEITLIAMHQSNNTKHGYNIANGGNASGCVSETTKQNLSRNRIGSKNPMYGVCGKDNPRSIKINQYDVNGKLVREWDCSADAERALGISKSKIIATCRNRRKSAGGYQWRYHGESGNSINKYSKKSVDGINNPMYGRVGSLNKRSKKVNQYDMSGNFVKTWISATVVDKAIGVPFRDISSCCHGNRKEAGGYIWKFASLRRG